MDLLAFWVLHTIPPGCILLLILRDPGWVQACQRVKHPKHLLSLTQTLGRRLVEVANHTSKAEKWLNDVPKLWNEVFTDYSCLLRASLELTGCSDRREALSWLDFCHVFCGALEGCWWHVSFTRTHTFLHSFRYTEQMQAYWTLRRTYILQPGCYCWTYGPVFACIRLHPCDKWRHQFVITINKFLLALQVKASLEELKRQSRGFQPARLS